MSDIFNKLTFGTSIRKKKRKKSETVEEVLPNEEPKDVGFVESKKKKQSKESSPGIRIFSKEVMPSKSKVESEESKLKRRKEEEIACFRHKNKIFLWGEDVPHLITEFSSPADVPKQLLSNINDFDIKKPTPVQMQSIPVMLARRELLASAPTGSGKTLAFVYPIIVALLKRKQKFGADGKLYALILEPTKELAKQVYLQFKKFGSNLSIECAFMDNDSALSKAEVVVSTPNRIAHLCNTGEKQVLNRLKHVRWLIVDEADRLFDTIEGDEKCFRTQIAKIYQACCGKYIRRAFFSATFSYEVEEWCKQNLPNLVVVCIGARNMAVENVEQKLMYTGSEFGKIIALRNLFREAFHPPMLIFVQSKSRARQLFAEIKAFENSVPCGLISSEQCDKERGKTITAFREGKIWVLICTEIMGRGLDLVCVNMVLNFDLPTSIISYIHRIGRTGRAGRKGFAISYFTDDDLDIVRPIANMIKQAGFPVPEYTLKLRKPTRNRKKEILRRAPQRKNVTRLKRSRNRRLRNEKSS